MFFIDFGDFLNDSLPFGFNTMKANLLFCMFFYFQGPYRHQMDPIFLSCHFVKK
jgi:hypothetical protein